MLITRNEDGWGIADAKHPIPLYVPSGVRASYKESYRLFTTELDPCLVRLAAGVLNKTAITSGWTAPTATTNRRIPASRIITLTPSPSDPLGDIQIFDSAGNALADQKLTRSELAGSTDPTVQQLHQRTRYLILDSRAYQPQELTIFAQASLSIQALGGFALVGVGTTPDPSAPSVRWITVGLACTQNYYFSFVTLPSALNLNGLENGSNLYAGSINVPFPKILPADWNGTDPLYYFVGAGYSNGDTSERANPYCAVGVLCQEVTG